MSKISIYCPVCGAHLHMVIPLVPMQVDCPQCETAFAVNPSIFSVASKVGGIIPETISSGSKNSRSRVERRFHRTGLENSPLKNPKVKVAAGVIGAFALSALAVISWNSSKRDAWNRGIALLEQGGLDPDMLPDDAPEMYYSATRESKENGEEMLENLKRLQAGAKYLVDHGYPAKDVPHLKASQLSDAQRAGASGDAQKLDSLAWDLRH